MRYGLKKGTETMKKNIKRYPFTCPRVFSNENIVLNCPYNKITTTLKPLLEFIQDKYDIKDIRSLFACYPNINSRKAFLDKLKNIIYISKENVC